MKICISILFLFSVLLGTQGKNDAINEQGAIRNCLYSAFEQCKGPADKAFRALSGIPDEKFLLDQCDNLLSQIRCRSEFNETCVVPAAYHHPFKGNRALLLAVEDLCNEESTWRRSYIENVECLNDHLKDFVTDIKQSFETMDEFVQHYEISDEVKREDEEILKCVFFSDMHAGVTNTLQSLCGEDAADLFLTLEERLLDNSYRLCPEKHDEVQHYRQLLEEYKAIRRPLEPILNAIGVK